MHCFMHEMAGSAGSAEPGAPHSHAAFDVRPAVPADASDIHALIETFSTTGHLLPRSLDQIRSMIEQYVVVADMHDRVVACAALLEYSPSLAEVGSVAVLSEFQGRGVGTMVVRAVEAMASHRGIDELFAVSTADGFFRSLGYARTALGRYPEKLARYAASGHSITTGRKPCFRKIAA
ncbi:MAG: Amino-acid acetyltransferase [Gemmatimonadaceae bacterium]|nr:Amino-acid acetyltransferase [Gemmatimonadaceae bacterium]